MQQSLSGAAGLLGEKGVAARQKKRGVKYADTAVFPGSGFTDLNRRSWPILQDYSVVVQSGSGKTNFALKFGDLSTLHL